LPGDKAERDGDDQLHPTPYSRPGAETVACGRERRAAARSAVSEDRCSIGFCPGRGGRKMDGQVLCGVPSRQTPRNPALLFVADKMLHHFLIAVFAAALCFAVSSMFWEIRRRP
jgi:hypothetical protein